MTEKRKVVIEIFEAILEEQNGFTKKEIKEGNLGEDCEGCILWDKIESIIEKL